MDKTPVIPEAAQPAYASLLRSLHAAPLPTRGLSWFTREVKGRPYWYQQYVVGARRCSTYVGPDDDLTRELVEQARRQKRRDAESAGPRKALVATCVAAGAAPTLPALARVLEAIAQAGVFDAGGVLLSPLTGSADEVTIALPNRTLDLASALRTADRAALPAPVFAGDAPDTIFHIRGERIRVRIETPEYGRPKDRPVYLPAFVTCARTVRGLERVFNDASEAVVLHGAGTLVRIAESTMGTR